MNLPALEIETARLRLRPFTLADLPALIEMRADPEVARYLTITPSPPEQVERDLHAAMARWRERGYDRWAVDDKETGAFMGWCGLQQKPDHVDLGYAVARAYWGRGFTTEAARAAIRHGFEELKFETITAIALPENVGSWRVMEKLGMKFRQRVPYQEFPAVVFYTIERTDFRPDGSLYIFHARHENRSAES
ncbi:MAG TPA: GNAT family N-acetyltransferase [Pyrinomonadaceae bacterium]|jgi:ribosomal-protein-alanine N-acetyltransferase